MKIEGYSLVAAIVLLSFTVSRGIAIGDAVW
jgi:hypothetical protein